MDNVFAQNNIVSVGYKRKFNVKAIVIKMVFVILTCKLFIYLVDTVNVFKISLGETVKINLNDLK